MENKINFSTWEEIRKPDKNYSMTYPYVTIKLNGETILEKFPFSPFLGRHNNFHGILADISTYSNKEFSVQIYQKNKQIDFKREFSTLQNAYEWFYNYK